MIDPLELGVLVAQAILTQYNCRILWFILTRNLLALVEVELRLDRSAGRALKKQQHC